MSKILSYESYEHLNESYNSFSTELDLILNEKIEAAIKTPIKFTKIKNNAKKYQKALVQKALLNVDYEKKKVAGMEPDKREILKAATDAKKSSLDDLLSSIGDRMNSLATTEPLKQVVSLVKSKAKVSAAETSLKSADAEETKQLKATIKKLNQKAADIQKDMKETPKKDEPKKDEPKKDEPKKDEPKKDEPKKDEPKKETAVEKKEAERKAPISKKIEDVMQSIQKAESDKKVAQSEKEELVKKLNDEKGTEKELELAPEVAAADKAIKDIDDAIIGFKQNLKDLRKTLKE